MTQSALIAALENAPRPERALDSLIALEIEPERFKDLKLDADSNLGILAGIFGIAYYTASLDAALTLVPEGMWWLVGCGQINPTEPLYGAQIRRPGFSTGGEVVCETEHNHMAIALCLAALKARALKTAK